MNNTVKWPFLRPFLAIFCQLYSYLAQKWGSDGRFEVLNRSASGLVQTLFSSDVDGGLEHAWLTLKKYQLINGHFTTIAGHFFAKCMYIFHKTEVQTVILKCLTSLNPNWYKSYDTKRKNARNANECFCTKLPKIGNGNICSLCHNLWTNQILDLLSTSKRFSEPQFCERYTYSWRKNGQEWW